MTKERRWKALQKRGHGTTIERRYNNKPEKTEQQKRGDGMTNKRRHKSQKMGDGMTNMRRHNDGREENE